MDLRCCPVVGRNSLMRGVVMGAHRPWPSLVQNRVAISRQRSMRVDGSFVAWKRRARP